MASIAPAWYIIRSEHPLVKWFNLLHWPYTLWHLSYVAIGAAFVPHLDYVLLGWTVLAFFLGMGIAGHAFDLVSGDPLKLGIRPQILWAIGFIAIASAAFIGAFQIALGNVDSWILVIIPFGIVMSVGYGNEWKYLHGDWQFSAWWAVFPLFVGYFAQSSELNWVLIPLIVFAFSSSWAQRVLSTKARYLRRKVGKTSLSMLELGPSGIWIWVDKDKEWLLDSYDLSLMALNISVIAIAVLLII